MSEISIYLCIAEFQQPTCILLFILLVNLSSLGLKSKFFSTISVCANINSDQENSHIL